MKRALSLLAFIALIALATASPCISDGGGDPRFHGFQGQKFDFLGYEGGYFNLFSDPWINVNAKFSYAKIDEDGIGSGTAISDIGMLLGSHKIHFRNMDSKPHQILLTVDDVEVILNEAQRTLAIGDCIELRWYEGQLLVSTFNMDFKFVTHRKGHNNHIPMGFINIVIERILVEDNIEDMGGVIGQTGADARPQVSSTLWETDSIFGTTAQGSKFLGRELECTGPKISRALLATRAARIAHELRLSPTEPGYSAGDCHLVAGKSHNYAAADQSQTFCLDADVSTIYGFADLSTSDQLINVTVSETDMGYFLFQPRYDVGKNALIFGLDKHLAKNYITIEIAWEYNNAWTTRDFNFKYDGGDPHYCDSFTPTANSGGPPPRQNGETCTGVGGQGNCITGYNCASPGVCTVNTGCIAGDSMVTMGDGVSTKRADALVVGDLIMGNDGTATITVIIKKPDLMGKLISLDGGPLISTPDHPYAMPDAPADYQVADPVLGALENPFFTNLMHKMQPGSLISRWNTGTQSFDNVTLTTVEVSQVSIATPIFLMLAIPTNGKTLGAGMIVDGWLTAGIQAMDPDFVLYYVNQYVKYFALFPDNSNAIITAYNASHPAGQSLTQYCTALGNNPTWKSAISGVLTTDYPSKPSLSNAYFQDWITLVSGAQTALSAKNTHSSSLTRIFGFNSYTFLTNVPVADGLSFITDLSNAIATLAASL